MTGDIADTLLGIYDTGDDTTMAKTHSLARPTSTRRRHLLRARNERALRDSSSAASECRWPPARDYIADDGALGGRAIFTICQNIMNHAYE